MKTNNYLGKHDQNRGIVLFGIIFAAVMVMALIIFAISTSGNDSSRGISSVDSFASSIQRTPADVTVLNVNENKLQIKGALTENVNETLLSKLKNVQIVFKCKDGDKYEYDTNYYISSEGVKFNSILKDQKESSINLEEVEDGEYFVFLKLTFISAKSENGYNVRYYTLENNIESEENTIENERFDISFESSNKVSTYLTIKNKEQ